jgi:restriction system protein
MELAGLTDDQRTVMLSSGQSKAHNRIGWAISFLTRIDAVKRPSRGRYVIADLGRELLVNDPDQISEARLKHLYTPGASRQLPQIDTGVVRDELKNELDPIEQIERGLERIHEAVSSDLLQRLQEKNPAFFEAAVVKLLVAMGYGGADGKATVTQQSHDGGIDGVIDRDALGLDRVYIQAKRYQSNASVQRPEVQAFVGALSGKASTGVFITTGSFSKGAIEYASTAYTRIILIDGARLTELMIRYGVGVQVQRSLNVVEVDEDFFE